MNNTLTPEAAAAAVAKLALMAYFPGDRDIRAALVWVLLEMVETEEQMDWLVNRALRLYGNWPGVGELRALYCSRWKPKDGMEAFSTVYPEGIPSERPRPVMRDAPRGQAVTADPALNRQIQQAAGSKKFQPGRREAGGDQKA